jgi:hypothetical protein
MRLILAVLALCLPSLSFAEPIETQKIITALTGDFNGDDAQDLVMVVETTPTDPMVMYFFLRDKDHNCLKQVTVVRDQIYAEWNGYGAPGHENRRHRRPCLPVLPQWPA